MRIFMFAFWLTASGVRDMVLAVVKIFSKEVVLVIDIDGLSEEENRQLEAAMDSRIQAALGPELAIIRMRCKNVEVDVAIIRRCLLDVGGKVAALIAAIRPWTVSLTTGIEEDEEDG